jgi:hypothetical protein
MAVPTELTDAIKAMAVPTELTDAIKAMAVPTELTDAIKAMAVPTELTDAIKAMAVPTELTDAIKAMAVPTELTDAIKAAIAKMAMPVELTDLFARTAEQWREIHPSNWPDELSWSAMRSLIADTGWSLVYVPRAAVISALAEATPSDRPSTLMLHSNEVIADCRDCLGEIESTGATHLVIALVQALDAFEAGLYIPALATAGSVLADVVNRVLGLSFSAAVKQLTEDPDSVSMPFDRFWLIASTIPAALARFHFHAGDQVPDRFNRHAVAHTVDPRQYTELNALVALMLTTGLVREISDDLPNDEPTPKQIIGQA